MGSWGIGISSNDTFQDIYNTFFDLYDDGEDVKDITDNLITENVDIINDEFDYNNFWFAIAKSQWECKELDVEILNRIKLIEESQSDVKIWSELGATKEELKKRSIILKKFIETLSSEKKSPRKRKKKKIIQPIFDKGDCLSFKLSSGLYGGLVVLDAEKESQLGNNLILVTRINQKEEPTLKDFENAEVLVANFANWKDDLKILWVSPRERKTVWDLLKKQGSIDIRIDYTHKDIIYKFGFIGSFEHLIFAANKQFQEELLRNVFKPKTTKKVKDFIHKSIFSTLISKFRRI